MFTQAWLIKQKTRMHFKAQKTNLRCTQQQIQQKSAVL